MEKAWYGGFIWEKDGGQRSLLSGKEVLEADVGAGEANEVGRNVVRSCKGYRNWGECVLPLTRK